MQAGGQTIHLHQDYFALFNLPRQFDIDAKHLSRRFYAIQKDIHPDRFASATEAEKRLSLQYATLVNQAYEVLRSPVQRALYLLHLLGVSMPEETTGQFSQDFLVRQLMLREQLEELDSLEAVDAFRKEVDREQELLAERLCSLLADSDLSAAAECVRRMQFVDKLHREAGLQEEKLLNRN